MALMEWKQFLFWCTVVNYLVLLVWFGAFALARPWVYRLHTRWYRLTPEQFDVLNYAGAALYKVLILVFNLAPLVALGLMS